MAKVIEFRIIESEKESVVGEPYSYVTAKGVSSEDSDITIDDVKESLQRLVDTEKNTTFKWCKALGLLDEGIKITNERWNRTGMWIERIKPKDGDLITRSYLCHCSKKGSTDHFGANVKDIERVPWLPSNTDLVSNTWKVYNG